MTHSDVCYLIAVIVFIVGVAVAAWEKALYPAIIAAGLTAVALGLLLA